MNRSRIRLLVYSIVGVLVMLGELVLLPQAYDVTPGRSRAESWVVAHASELPTTLDDFDAFPVAYRHRIFQSSQAETKSKLWRQHLAKTLGTHPEFTAAQKALIGTMITTLTPEVFAASESPAPGSKVSELCRMAAEVFSPQQRLIFATLGEGPAEGSFRNFQVARLLISNKLRDALVVEAALEPFGDCYCNQGSWCECGSQTCSNGGPHACNTNGDNCGCFWLWECDGMCNQY